MQWLWFIIAGLLSGLAAGMGMGGGTILIPVLTLLLGVEQHGAQGVNIVAFIPAAAFALLIHHREGRLGLKECLPVIISGAVSAGLAALLPGLIDAPWLKRLFGVFLILLAVLNMVMKKKTKG